METKIREARIDDYQALCNLHKEGDTYHHELAPNIFSKPSDPVRTKEYLEEILNDELSALFIVEHDDEIIGFIYVKIKNPTDLPIFVQKPYGYVSDIIITRGQQGKGVGKILMAKADEWVKGKGFSEIRITVWECNEDALRFYEKLGYETIVRSLHKSV